MDSQEMLLLMINMINVIHLYYELKSLIYTHELYDSNVYHMFLMLCLNKFVITESVVKIF